jgi:hypothetical protein
MFKEAWFWMVMTFCAVNLAWVLYWLCDLFGWC